MNFLKISAFLIFIFGVATGISQTTNNTCANASPYCTGQTMTFPATTGSGGSQPGPFYGCLFSQPNPAWFFMQIATGGSLGITMSAANDIDFICWGPFPSLSGACNNLVSTNVQSCSYSPSNTETCTIANAIPGMFYLMLITNFSNTNQNITFSQTSGNASTNCGFVCLLTPTNSGMACAGGAVTVSLAPGTSSAVTSYTWSGPNAFSSTSALNILSGLQSSGTYTVRGTASSTIGTTPYTSTCMATTNVTVVQYPQYSVTPTTTTICQGGSLTGAVTFTIPTNPALYSYNWTPMPGGGIVAPFSQTTIIQPPLLPAAVTLSTVVYNITVQPNFTQVSCPITQALIVTINNPATPTLTMPAPLCDISNPVMLMASPGGGTWSANPAVTSGGFFSPAAASTGTNWVSYAVTVGTCIVNNTASVQVSKFHTAALSSVISPRCVQDPPFKLMNIVQDSLTGSWSGPNVSGNFFSPAALATGIYNLTYSTVSVPNPTTCPASTILAVYVFNPPTPTISLITPKCTNAATVMLTANPSGGVWQAISGISPNGIQNPAQNLIGTNSLTYSAGQGTCLASSSRTFHVSQFNSAALTATVPHLCATSNPFNLMTIVQNTSGIWSGPGVSSTNIFLPAGLSSSIYTLTYLNPSTPNTALCPDTRKIAASVLNPPTPSITLAGPYCTNQAVVQMSVTPAAGSWVTTSYVTSSGLFSPKNSPIGTNAVQYVIGTNTCNSKQTIQVITEAFVPADILGSVPDLCTTGSTVSLGPLASNALGTWSGPGVIGAIFNPALSNAGLFKLIYKTSSSPGGLCPDADTLAVRVYSLETPVIKPVGPFCNSFPPQQLQVSPLGGVFNSNNSGAIDPAGLFQPALGLIGNNLVSYSVSAGPCMAFAQSTIAVERFVSADFEKQVELAYCRNRRPFELNSLVKNPGGFWSGPGVIGSMFDPAKANTGENNIIVYNTHSEPTVLLCPDSSAVRIKIKDVPSVTASGSTHNGCVPLSVTFRSPEYVTGKTSWLFNDNSPPQTGFVVNHVFTLPGVYEIVFNYWDNEAEGCSAQYVLPNLVTVFDVPQAAFAVTPEEVTLAAPEIQLTNTTKILGDNKYLWTIQTMQPRSEVHPKVIFPDIGTYKITLVATNYNGCKDEFTRYVEVKSDFNVFIPNSFSPNFDGLNDTFLPVFSPYGVDPKTFEMEIYDRWGHLIFTSHDHTKGWDGSFQNNTSADKKQDSYTYRIKFKDSEGRAYDKFGTITLL